MSSSGRSGRPRGDGPSRARPAARPCATSARCAGCSRASHRRRPITPLTTVLLSSSPRPSRCGWVWGRPAGRIRGTGGADAEPARRLQVRRGSRYSSFAQRWLRCTVGAVVDQNRELNELQSAAVDAGQTSSPRRVTLVREHRRYNVQRNGPRRECRARAYHPTARWGRPASYRRRLKFVEFPDLVDDTAPTGASGATAARSCCSDSPAWTWTRRAARHLLHRFRGCARGRQPSHTVNAAATRESNTVVNGVMGCGDGMRRHQHTRCAG